MTFWWRKPAQSASPPIYSRAAGIYNICITTVCNRRYKYDVQVSDERLERMARKMARAGMKVVENGVPTRDSIISAIERSLRSQEQSLFYGSRMTEPERLAYFIGNWPK